MGRRWRVMVSAWKALFGKRWGWIIFTQHVPGRREKEYICIDACELRGIPLMSMRASEEEMRRRCLVKEGESRWLIGLNLEMRIS